MNSKLEDSGASSKPKRARLDVSVAVVQNVREPLNLTTLPVEVSKNPTQIPFSRIQRQPAL